MRLLESAVTVRLTLVSAWYVACLFLIICSFLWEEQCRKAGTLGMHWMVWAALTVSNPGHLTSCVF